MLKSFARHGLFNLDVKVKGDIEVDCHHTIEDTGIVLGEAIKKHWEIKIHQKVRLFTASYG